MLPRLALRIHVFLAALALVTAEASGATLFRSWGTDQNAGNLLGVQAWLEPRDYLTEATFEARLRAPLDEAQKRGWIGPRTIVIFPEMIGTWLLAEGTPSWSRSWILESPTTSRALTAVIFNHLPGFLREWWNAPSSAMDTVTHAVFSSRAGAISKIYSRVFSKLSREYSVTIVAGSIVLPGATLDSSGAIQVGDGPLYNTSAVFAPNGSIQGPLLRKVYTTSEEQPFTACGSGNPSPIFDTPAGRLAVLICADSWFPASYVRIRDQAPLLAIPSFAGTAREWHLPWKGYSGQKNPDDIDPRDIGKLSESQAWKKYSMGGRAGAAGVTHGMNLFFTGSLWNLHPEGGALIFRKTPFSQDLFEEGPPAPGHDRILNLWIERKHK